MIIKKKIREKYKLLGYVCFMKSIKERKKSVKENGFLIFGFTMKN